MAVLTFLREHGGLLSGDARRIRVSTFINLLIVATSMTFMQFGFVGLGERGHYYAYLMALLAPISVSALLLGWQSSTLMGLSCGAVLLAHSQLMPLDPIEGYLIHPQNSIFLYGGAGLALGIAFELIRRGKLAGIRRYLALSLACTVVSVFASLLLNITLYAVESNYEEIKMHLYSGSPLIQMLGDAGLMIVSCVAIDILTQRYQDTKNYRSMRDTFRMHLLGSLIIAYLMATSISFVATTLQERDAAYDNMGGELTFLSDQIEDRLEQFDSLQKLEKEGKIEFAEAVDLLDMVSVENLIAGYDLTDGSIVLTYGGEVYASNNPAFKVGDSLGKGLESASVEMAAEDGSMHMILYDEGTEELHLGFMRAMRTKDGSYISMVMPFPLVFELRSIVMFWTGIIVFVLLILVYVMVARLLNKVVMHPIVGINQSLGKITQGDFDEVVHEVDSVEFATLSSGINITVDTMKGWIGEAKRRIERELETARSIQVGALPRQFPAFPNVDCVDLYASMNPALDVGGDFYDYFTVDEHTACFLIADVSGKGIPGALFMMSAKTEIQNRLLSGMEPAEAISTANKYLCAHNEAGMFVTVWAATLDWKTGLLTYVNAGHNFPLLRHGRGGTWEWLDKKCGLFLGTFESARYRQMTLTLQPGDELVLYTDGVNEAFSVNEEEYGNDRLEAFLNAHADERPQELVQSLRADVGRWAEGAEQSDDITILAVEYGV